MLAVTLLAFATSIQQRLLECNIVFNSLIECTFHIHPKCTRSPQVRDLVIRDKMTSFPLLSNIEGFHCIIYSILCTTFLQDVHEGTWRPIDLCSRVFCTLDSTVLLHCICQCISFDDTCSCTSSLEVKGVGWPLGVVPGQLHM